MVSSSSTSNSRVIAGAADRPDRSARRVEASSQMLSLDPSSSHDKEEDTIWVKYLARPADEILLGLA